MKMLYPFVRSESQTWLLKVVTVGTPLGVCVSRHVNGLLCEVSFVKLVSQEFYSLVSFQSVV